MTPSLPASPWSPDCRSIFSLLSAHPDGDIGKQVPLGARDAPDAPSINEQEIADALLSYCRSDKTEDQIQARNQILSKLELRCWRLSEQEQILKLSNWTPEEKLAWCDCLLLILQTAPNQTIVYNGLEQLNHCKAAIPGNILTILARHKQLIYPCFDILLAQQDMPLDDQKTLYTHMAEHIGGYRKLMSLKALKGDIPESLSRKLLAAPIEDVGQFAFPIEDNISSYLTFLSDSKLYATLSAGYPGELIVRNLAHTYAELSQIIFSDLDDEEFQEALKSFPLFTGYLAQTDLGLEDLHNLFLILENVQDFEDDLTSDKAPDLYEAINNINTIFNKDHTRNAILQALEDVATPDYSDIIDMAEWFYSIDKFEPYFRYARQFPLKGFAFSSWLYGMSDEQRHRFISWARSHFPDEVLTRSLQQDYKYSELQALLLEELISHAKQTLIDPKDYQDFLKWGLSSSDIFLAARAAWMLEALPVTAWPTGSGSVLEELAEKMEPRWTSHRAGKAKGINSKKRLAALASKASTPGGSRRTINLI